MCHFLYKQLVELQPLLLLLKYINTFDQEFTTQFCLGFLNERFFDVVYCSTVCQLVTAQTLAFTTDRQFQFHFQTLTWNGSMSICRQHLLSIVAVVTHVDIRIKWWTLLQASALPGRRTWRHTQHPWDKTAKTVQVPKHSQMLAEWNNL